MRPKTIVAFERIYLLTLLIGVFQAIIGWRQAIALASPGFVVTIQAVAFGLILALVLWVSRGRSKVAKWIMVGLFVLGLPGTFVSFRSGMTLGWPILTLSQTIMQVVALGLLFTPSARAWLSRKSDLTSRSELQRTFE